MTSQLYEEVTRVESISKWARVQMKNWIKADLNLKRHMTQVGQESPQSRAVAGAAALDEAPKMLAAELLPASKAERKALHSQTFATERAADELLKARPGQCRHLA